MQNHPPRRQPAQGATSVKAAMTFALNAFLAVLTIIAWSYIGPMLSAKSNESVAGGVVAAILLIAFWIAYLTINGQKILAWLTSRNAKHLAMLLFAVVGACATTGCVGHATINPGNVGIQVDNYGQNRGVQDQPIVVGSVWYNSWTTSIFEYPTSTQTVSWTKDVNEGKPINEEITYSSSEGMPLSADVSLSYNLDASCISKFYVTFRTDDLSAFTNGYLHNVVRDAFNNHAVEFKAEDLYGKDKEKLVAEATQQVMDKVKPLCVNVTQMGYIGTPRPPTNVSDAINNKMAAQQNAIAAENTANANTTIAKSITPNLIQWQMLDLYRKALDKWNGVSPTYIAGSGSGSPGVIMPFGPGTPGQK